MHPVRLLTMPEAILLSDNDRFSGLKSEYQDRSINNALKENRISSADAALISAFVAEKRITAGISPKRSLKIVSSLVTVRRFIPQYHDLTIPSLYTGVDRINNAPSRRGTPFSRNTRIDLVIILKQFVLWLIDNEEITLPEKKVRSIKIPKKLPSHKASELLTGDEIQALISVCMTSRDRALLMTMYEGGFRVGEIGEMRWGHLKMDETGIVVNVTFKTMKPRYVRLVMAKEHLIKWKSDYPEKITDDALVFINERRKPMTHAAVTRQLTRLSLRAGITKHVFPHIFRHSRITHLIQQGVNESVIKLMMWGSIDSRMFINYAHLTGTDIDREICKLYGIEATNDQFAGEPLEPRVCPKCREVNSPVARLCHVCGQALLIEPEVTADIFAEYVKEHPDILINYLKQFSLPKK